MPPTPNRTWSSSGSDRGHGNLFLEADPEAVPARARSRRSASARRPAPTRGRGLVVPIEESVPLAAPVPQRPDAAAFTRTSTRLGGVQGRAREHAQRADANARQLLAGLAARPYAALIALAVVGAMLLALSWIGLALRNATTARHDANRRAAVAAIALNRDQARITALSGRLEQARPAQAQEARTNQKLHAATAGRPAAKPAAHRPAHAKAGQH